MLLLFSSPEKVPDEALLLNRMLERHPGLLFHLRKPTWELPAVEQLLQEIDSAFHPRIVIHQHHGLDDRYTLKGVHFTTHHRETEPLHPRVVSTSFHSLAEAAAMGEAYSYFCCSPVFESISKSGYTGSESWDISALPDALREKAVALGGIDNTTLPAARDKGFRHFAVLGAVWQAADPEAALDMLYHLSGD